MNLRSPIAAAISLTGWVVALLSLLTVFRAPAYPLWIVAIFVSEYGHIFAPICLGIFFWKPSHLSWLIAGIFFAVPLVRAVSLASALPAQLQAAYGPTTIRPGQRTRPLVFKELFTGIPVAPMLVRTTVYAAPNGLPLKMDLYGVRPGASQPALLVIHGGSWAEGTRDQLPTLNHYLAARGVLVAAIDYRLARVAHFPAPIEDVRAAIAYLKSHANELGFDGRNVVLLGRSAGGQIALYSAYTLHDPAIRGVIGFYAPADMEFAFLHPSNPLVMDSPRVLRNYVGSDRLEDFRRASAVQTAGPDAPPTLLIHGNPDSLVWITHSEHLKEKLRALGRRVYFLRLPWATHGADYIFNGPSGQLSTYAIERFLAAVVA
jgi:acetyl esterase/lipase